MANYNYERLASRAKANIAKYGGTVYLKVPVDGKVNAGTGQITYNQIVIPAKAIVTGYSTSEVNNVNVLENDKKVLIDTDSGKPLVNNIVEINGIEFRILEADDIAPGVDEPVVYILHVRNTTLAEDLDGFVTTLQGLNPGDIVVDPSNPRGYPNWIKLVSDYPIQDITMLTEQYAYESYMYNDEAPTLNRWLDTKLYEYLHYEYIYRYSADFYDILQSPLVETRDYFKQENITLLSSTETHGNLISGETSGRQIPYFEDNNFRRILVDKDEFVNVNYWTRDYYGGTVGAYKALGVSTEGDLYAYLISNLLAIRACVFINNNQRVKLNDDGITYSILYD